MRIETSRADNQRKEELEALNRLCVYVAGEAKSLDVPEAEMLGSVVSQRIGELLSGLSRNSS